MEEGIDIKEVIDYAKLNGIEGYSLDAWIHFRKAN
jgi:hypothetical protein